MAAFFVGGGGVFFLLALVLRKSGGAQYGEHAAHVDMHAKACFFHVGDGSVTGVGGNGGVCVVCWWW